MEFDKKTIVDIDGVIESGKQFDLDLRIPEDKRNVIYGIVKDPCGRPIEDAVVKLVEVTKDNRYPVSHAITDKEGEFVFGPLCPHKAYAIQIWVNRVKHIKICETCDRDGSCLKGDYEPCDECSKKPSMKYEIDEVDEEMDEKLNIIDKILDKNSK